MVSYEKSLDEILTELAKHNSGLTFSQLEAAIADKISSEFQLHSLLESLSQEGYISNNSTGQGTKPCILAKGTDLIKNKNGFVQKAKDAATLIENSQKAIAIAKTSVNINKKGVNIGIGNIVLIVLSLTASLFYYLYPKLPVNKPQVTIHDTLYQNKDTNNQIKNRPVKPALGRKPDTLIKQRSKIL
jgi:hypothetical protein